MHSLLSKSSSIILLSSIICDNDSNDSQFLNIPALLLMFLLKIILILFFLKSLIDIILFKGNFLLLITKTPLFLLFSTKISPKILKFFDLSSILYSIIYLTTSIFIII